MTGHDGRVSPPAPLRARAGPISGSSAAPGRSAGGLGANSMKWGKEPALAGSSSAATMGSPPPPSKSQKGREAEAQGGKKKSKKAVLDASGVRRLCSLCGRSFKNQKAVNAHMSVHKTPRNPQVEEVATGHDGQVSPPAPLRARAGPISGSSAAPGGSAGGRGANSMKWGKEPALAGSSSAATMGSPPCPSKSQKGREAEAQGGKKKSKKAVLDASGVRRLCSLCAKSFKSQNAVNAHMCVHKTPQKPQKPQKQQAEELASILLDLGQRKLETMEGREPKGDGSALAGGGASSSVAEAQRKKIHMALDLNEEAPEDDDNDDEDYLGEDIHEPSVIKKVSSTLSRVRT